MLSSTLLNSSSDGRLSSGLLEFRRYRSLFVIIIILLYNRSTFQPTILWREKLKMVSQLVRIYTRDRVHVNICWGPYCTCVCWGPILHMCLLGAHTAHVSIGGPYSTCVCWGPILHMCLLGAHTAHVSVGGPYCTCVYWGTILHMCLLGAHTAHAQT